MWFPLSTDEVVDLIPTFGISLTKSTDVNNKYTFFEVREEVGNKALSKEAMMEDLTAGGRDMHVSSKER